MNKPESFVFATFCLVRFNLGIAYSSLYYLLWQEWRALQIKIVITVLHMKICTSLYQEEETFLKELNVNMPEVCLQMADKTLQNKTYWFINFYLAGALSNQILISIIFSDKNTRRYNRSYHYWLRLRLSNCEKI